MTVLDITPVPAIRPRPEVHPAGEATYRRPRHVALKRSDLRIQRRLLVVCSIVGSVAAATVAASLLMIGLGA